MGIFSFFKQSPKKFDNSTILWEDDYLMIELLPRDNLQHAINETKRVSDFGQDHFDGVGFTDITEVDSGKAKTEQLKLNLPEFEENLKACKIGQIEVVLYEGKPIDTSKTLVYGENTNGLYIDHENGFIKDIWLAFYDRSKLPKSPFLNTLTSIGEKYNLILVDWSRGFVVDLKQKSQIENYLLN